LLELKNFVNLSFRVWHWFLTKLLELFYVVFCKFAKCVFVKFLEKNLFICFYSLLLCLFYIQAPPEFIVELLLPDPLHIKLNFFLVLGLHDMVNQFGDWINNFKHNETYRENSQVNSNKCCNAQRDRPVIIKNNNLHKIWINLLINHIRIVDKVTNNVNQVYVWNNSCVINIQLPLLSIDWNTNELNQFLSITKINCYIHWVPDLLIAVENFGMERFHPRFKFLITFYLNSIVFFI